MGKRGNNMKRKLAVVCIMALSATAILSGCGRSDKSGDGKTKIGFAIRGCSRRRDEQQELLCGQVQRGA